MPQAGTANAYCEKQLQTCDGHGGVVLFNNMTPAKSQRLNK